MAIMSMKKDQKVKNENIKFKNSKNHQKLLKVIASSMPLTICYLNESFIIYERSPVPTGEITNGNVAERIQNEL